MGHIMARIAPTAPAKKEVAVRKKSSLKAVQTRKGKYGESKMKRDTREKKKKQGHNMEKENR